MPQSVRLWVEDHLLTVAGYRNSQDLADALAKLGRTDLDTLVTSRLLRIDDRFGTQRVELTHDVLAAPVRASRDDRHCQEELARAARREREIREELRIVRRRMALVMVLVLALLGFGCFSYWQWHKATIAESKADDASRHARSPCESPRIAWLPAWATKRTTWSRRTGPPKPERSFSRG